MSRQRLFLRSAAAGGDLEVFLVAAVTAVLGIRFYLRLTGYPQIGGSTLHVAHMLWGGLLMLAALVLLLSFLGRRTRTLAALLGGLGFGTFIDEVGKFVTRDNDYFFQPAVAIMYTVFVVVFLVLRSVHGRSLTRTEHLLNAVHELEEVALHDLDRREQRRALGHLERADPGHPLVPELRRLLTAADALPPPRPGRLARLRRTALDRYRRLATSRLFAPGLIAFFTLQAAARVAHVVALVMGWRIDPEIGSGGGITGHVLHRLSGVPAGVDVLDRARLATTLASGAFVVAGIVALLRGGRPRAYEMFRRSVLVTIFLTQVLIFYEEEFSALVGLVFNVLLLVALRSMIRAERDWPG